ncbi:DUF6351 family protein [Aquihabitans sp. McL0605]|uniref:DUF6351 family protein n=1 Tax=Aquihabitans sp. McL0605 TaxID=3415671 RepID=UPI003CEB008A
MPVAPLPSSTRRPRPALRLLALALGVALTAAACSTDSSPDASSSRGGSSTTTEDPSQGGPSTTGPLGSGTAPIHDGLRIEVLSSQPDRVSGDDARIRVTPPNGTGTSGLRVTRDDRDVTASLEPIDGSLEGVITGLIEGNNTLRATGGGKTTVQRIRAWPRTGPMISGPHLPLLACSTAEQGLGPPTDQDCSAPSKVSWRYIDTKGRLKALPAGAAAPTDLGTTTVDGVRVPSYVRVEQGVINRSVYEIATLSRAPGDHDLGGPGWNQKLLYRFGGVCGTTYGQGRPATSAIDPTYLRQGYAVATASFDNADVQCNDVLAAETAMMVKERVIEELGVPAFTIGEGAAGGAAQLHLLAQNYPGVVNGVVAVDPFADTFSVWPGATDCGLLLHYFGTARGAALTPAQRQAIDGHASAETCARWKAQALGELDPSKGCDPQIPPASTYDPKTNRGGVRCTLQDGNRNQVGIEPGTGWAQRPLDNVGVQYGLEALDEGTITFDEFVDLNTAIGGYDDDGRITGQREEADPDVVMHAYETGRVSMGGGDQSTIPIIDITTADDASGTITDRFRPFSLRDRLTRGGKADTAPGFQIWSRAPGHDDTAKAVAVVDEWLTALEADAAGGDMSAVLLRTRPDAAVDNCLPAGAATPISGVDVFDADGACTKAFPLSGDPRTAAGGPRADHVLKCALKAIDPLDYAEPLTATQLQDLLDVFPQGVCDWNTPSEGQVVPANPDRSYEDVETPGQDA